MVPLAMHQWESPLKYDQDQLWCPWKVSCEPHCCSFQGNVSFISCLFFFFFLTMIYLMWFLVFNELWLFSFGKRSILSNVCPIPSLFWDSKCTYLRSVHCVPRCLMHFFVVVVLHHYFSWLWSCIFSTELLLSSLIFSPAASNQLWEPYMQLLLQGFFFQVHNFPLIVFKLGIFYYFIKYINYIKSPAAWFPQVKYVGCLSVWSLPLGLCVS